MIREPSNKTSGATSGGQKRSDAETQIPSRKKNKDDSMVRNNTNYSKITVQHLINNILWEAELGKYDNPPVNQFNPITNSSPLTVSPAFNNYSYGSIPSTSSTSSQHQSFNIQPSIENNNFSTSWPSSSFLEFAPPASQQIDYTLNNMPPQGSKTGEVYNKDYY
ncbi:MADF domain-containing protein [Aphis craccivora]|uniref:MADF domain-containing protein n=1 Tax=Aphis craccivora TaxID=307492 RepID=A0A6G0W0L3_APHCR|nr:MADF domain-containing protein [Aphis craccivora]KAF0740718.1 MADF domain-containing protein [Aphis craccivora]